MDGYGTRYLYDGPHVIAEYDGNNNLLRKYIYGPGIDQPVCMIEEAESETYYYHFDALGSVVALSDSSGDTVQTYEYSVYGQVAAEDYDHPNPYMFAGRRFDIEIGLYYYRARYYNPFMGRFLQTDPIGYGDGMNRYAYCGNNSLNYVDPTGEYQIIIHLIYYEHPFQPWMDESHQDVTILTNEGGWRETRAFGDRQSLMDFLYDWDFSGENNTWEVWYITERGVTGELIASGSFAGGDGECGDGEPNEVGGGEPNSPTPPPMPPRPPLRCHDECADRWGVGRPGANAGSWKACDDCCHYYNSDGEDYMGSHQIFIDYCRDAGIRGVFDGPPAIDVNPPVPLP